MKGGERRKSRKTGGGGFFCTGVNCVNNNAVVASVPTRNPYVSQTAALNNLIIKAGKEISDLEDEIKNMSGTYNEKKGYYLKKLNEILKKYNLGEEHFPYLSPNGMSSPRNNIPKHIKTRKTRKTRKNSRR